MQLLSWLDACTSMHDALPASSQKDFLESQAAAFLDMLKEVVLDLDSANVLISKVKAMVCWSSSGLEDRLLRGVSLRTSSQIISCRKQTQDYTDMYHCLTEQVWSDLQSDDQTPDQKLLCLVTHLLKLGLRFPSEQTYATICALIHKDIMQFSLTERFDALQKLKPSVKRFCDIAEQTCVYFDSLPRPAACISRFPLLKDVPFVESKQDSMTFVALVKSIPLRCTNRFAKQLPSSMPLANRVADQNPTDLMAIMGGFMSSIMRMQGSSSPTVPHLQFTRTQKPSMLDDALAKSRALVDDAMDSSSSTTLPAIEDKPPGSDKPKPPVGKSALEVLELLKNKQPKKVKGKSKAMKKPSKTGAKEKKQPAKKQKQSGKKQKHPALKKKQQATTEQATKIPSQKERLRLRPHGCSKCRKRPGCCDSCWSQRKSIKK